MMKIFLFMSDEIIYQPKTFERLAQDLNNKIVGVAIVPVASVKRNLFKFFKDHIIMLGPTLFIIKIFQTFRAKILDRCSKFLKLRKCYSIDAIARDRSIRIYYTKNLNDEKFIRQLEQLNLDVIISVSQPQIIKKKLLTIPRLGIINVHPGMLPKYRGPAPFFWALMNDEPFFGITTHFMDEEIDSGPILVQKKIPISPKDSYLKLTAKVAKEIPLLIKETIRKLENRNFDLIPNDKSKASYCPYPKIWDAIRFRLRGKRTI